MRCEFVQAPLENFDQEVRVAHGVWLNPVRFKKIENLIRQ
jgi:hypothetical protein